VCGILGHFSFGARAPFSTPGPEVDLWRRLVDILAHRGPDDSTCWHEGAFFLGHRRLAIIDLREGHQPMATSDGQLVVTFNGEIYNYIELRDELTTRGHRFRTGSDTEVLLHGYREWGTGLPAKLRGMFAFALVDRARRELFAARDRFGEKPFFFTESGGGVSFASELKVLSALPDRSREIDDAALAAFLCLNYVPGERTLLAGVARLAPGTWRLWNADGEARAGVYWRPPAPLAAPLNLDMRGAIDRLDALLEASTRFALRSDVPVGLFLSGGIDSSLVGRSAARSGRLHSAFCLTFAEASYSEWPNAERTARQIGVPLQEVRLTADSLADFLPIVAHADDPLADSSALAVWTLSREAARHVKVVLGGDGGDELFAGYLTYPATLWHDAVTARMPSPVRHLLARAGQRLPTSERKVSASYKLRRFLRAADLPPAVAHFTWNGTWLPDEASRLVSGAARRLAVQSSLSSMAARHALSPHPSLAQLQTADVMDYLPNDILAKADRMSMAHGLEVRSPFLDPDLAEFALSLPAALKAGRTGATKRVLRELARRECGTAVSRAPKQGFSIPVHTWLRGPARPLVEDLLSYEALAPLQALDRAQISRVVADHMSGRRSYGFELWGLAVLSLWHRQHVQTRTPLPATSSARDVQLEPAPPGSC
jgi:asparagine synthase (glutamine-hydrolysing)